MIDRKKSITINLHSAYMENKLQQLIKSIILYITSATDYGVGNCAIIFTMNCGIHQATCNFWSISTYTITQKAVQA